MVDKEKPAVKNPKTTILITIALFWCSAFVISLVTFNEMRFSILILFFILTLIFFCSLWICTSKTFRQYRTDLFLIFYFTLFINILAMVYSAYMFHYNIGIYTGANDETKLYLEGDITGKGIAGQVRYIERRPYPVYLYLLTGISILSRYFGGNTPFNFKLLSTFLGGCVPVVIFTHFIRKYPLKRVKKIALISALFPGFIYYSSIGVRDIAIVFITALFFFLLIDKRRTLKRTVLLLMSIVVIFLLRQEHAAFILAIYLSYYIVHSIRQLDFIRLASILVYSAILLIGAIQFQDVLMEFVEKEIVEQQEFYARIFFKSVLRKQTMDTSLTYKIRNLPVPFNYIVIFGYNVLNNFPPYLLLESQVISTGSVGGSVGGLKKSRVSASEAKTPVSYGRIFKALGPFVWYFILPYVLLGLVSKKKYYHFDFDEKLIIYLCFVYIFGVSIFTTDIGRIVVVYTNLIPFGLMVRYQSPVAVRQKVDFLAFFGVFLLFAVYLTIKSSM